MSVEKIEKKMSKMFEPLNIKKLPNETQGGVFIYDHARTYMENKGNKQSIGEEKIQNKLKLQLKQVSLITLLKIFIFTSIGVSLYAFSHIIPVDFIKVILDSFLILNGVATLWYLYESTNRFLAIYEVYINNKQSIKYNRQIEYDSFMLLLCHLCTPVVIDGHHVDRLYRFLDVDKSDTKRLVFEFKTKDFNLISAYADELAKDSIEYQAKRIAFLSEETFIDIYMIIKEKEEIHKQKIYQKRKEQVYNKFTSNVYSGKESPLEESLKRVDNQIKDKQKEKRRNYEQSVEENQDLMDNLTKQTTGI